MKKILLSLIFVCLIFNLYSNSKEINDISNSGSSTFSTENVDKHISKKLTSYDVKRMIYWSTWGTVGFTAMMNSFGHLGYAYTITERLKSFDDSLGAKMDGETYENYINAYPPLVFAFHFLNSGFAFIPVVGGLIYGINLYGIAAAFSLMRMRSMNALVSNVNIDNLEESVKIGLEEIYQDIFDPTGYFAVGTISIILGVGELISFLIYNKARNKRKYPNINKVFTFTPTSVTIKLG